MAQIAQTSAVPAPSRTKVKSRRPETIREWTGEWSVRLLLALLVSELIFPYFIWRFRLPGALDFVQEIIAATIMAVTILHMIARDRIPVAVPVVLAVTLVWGLVAYFEGQSLAATAWGWWKLFKYPFVGLFAYMIVPWPRNFADWWVRFLVVLMAFEVGVQLIRLLLGEPPGDSLAGTFGSKGVGSQTSFNLFIIALSFGSWIALHRWKLLVVALVLGLASSMMNVTKFYIPGILVMSLLTIALQLIAGGRVRHLLGFVFALGLLGMIAIPVFNRFVADTRGLPELQEYFQPEKLEGYLFTDGQGDQDGTYNLGRGLAITYAYQTISRDMTTKLFGMGLGARSLSASLGIVGTGLENDLYGSVTAGTGVLVRLQEQGIVGLITLQIFFLWLMWRLAKDTRRHNNASLKALEFGLILYTLLWPLWLVLQNAWSDGVMMILYWVTVGYVFSEIARRKRVTAQQRPAVAGYAPGKRPIPAVSSAVYVPAEDVAADPTTNGVYSNGANGSNGSANHSS